MRVTRSSTSAYRRMDGVGDAVAAGMKGAGTTPAGGVGAAGVTGNVIAPPANTSVQINCNVRSACTTLGEVAP